ncbi:MAG: NAD-dependent epimerase/dehydratase family protein, partial [Terracidiphilus sp.]
VSLQFGPSYSRFSLELFGTQAAATVDFDRNTFLLHRHLPAGQDFDTYGQLHNEARSLAAQARSTLADYILTKAKLRQRGNPYGASIARAMEAFYVAGEPDSRTSGRLGARSIEICERMGDLANFPPQETAPAPAIVYAAPSQPAPELLILGATGFIGREVVRQLAAAGRRARLLVRSAAALPAELRTGPIEVVRGDLSSREDLLRALDGVRSVLHLARANVKTWADYQRYEIEATRRVAECALEAQVERLVYTGTIDSYYAGRRAGVITEATPLDPRIQSRNLYARAKAASEQLLMALHRERALPVVILRPGIVIGRGGSPFHWGVGMWWNDAVCQIWGDGTNKLPLVLVEDVARALLAARFVPGLEGRSFNLVADPCLSAQEYLDALDRAAGIQIDRRPTPIFSFYWRDLLKYCVKIALRHPERRLPSYRDWESRTQRARFDCSAAKAALDWRPSSDPETLIRQGIEIPVHEFLA